MPKRHSHGPDGQTPFRKRQKVVHEAPTSEEVHTARQLRQLLTFDQDVRRARHGLQSFKVFLDGLGTADEGRRERLDLLTEYLEAATPRDTSSDAVYLTDIMDMWVYASDVSNDSILSAVPAVLALLVQTISSSMDLLPHALGICQTLLRERQQKLISKNLSASKGSGFIISPTLRLLREMVCLDGGVLAKRVFRARDFTLASLARNLEIKHGTEGVEDVTKPSVRTNSIRLLLSFLKYLNSDGKKELLMQKEVFSHLTFLIKDDPPYLLLEMFEILKKHVLVDDKLPREVKFRTFNTKTLDRLAALYNYRHDVEGDGKPSVKDSVHGFLMHTCTTPGAGILYSGTGLYPRDLEQENLQYRKSGDDSGLEHIAWMDKFKDELPVSNFVLSEFIQKLRPWSSMKHSELLVAIFAAAPELLASYFLNNKSFSFEPKLSMTWLGYAAFLFNTIQLPIPAYFGHKSTYAKVPPPTSITLDNIIPLPLKQKDLVRCLSYKSNLVSFFAIRILVLAIQKLEKALRMHKEAAQEGNRTLWDNAARRLVDEFCQRIPDMKEVIKCYKSTSDDSVLQREAASSLLQLYYGVVPQLALMANFDVSPFLVSALGRLQKQREDPKDQALSLMELENLLVIAGFSPGMRWFAKADGLLTSPFIALLRVMDRAPEGVSLSRLEEVLNSIALQNQLILKSTGLAPLYEVTRKLAQSDPGIDLEPVWAFLDNCVNRCASSPLKYLDLLQQLAEELPAERGIKEVDGASVSLIILTMTEQLPFVAGAGAAEDNRHTFARFISIFITFARESDEDGQVLDMVAKNMNRSYSTEPDMSTIDSHDPVGIFLAGTVKRQQSSKASEAAGADGVDASEIPRPSLHEINDTVLEDMLNVPFSSERDNAALLKWSSKEVDDLVEEGHAAALIRLLLSEHFSIRQEALTNILKMAAKIRESSYEEKDQIWLLLSELAESSRGQVTHGPVPSALVAFAIHSLEVLRNPTHCLYPKVNSFLTRGPVWASDKLPLAHDIFHGEPSDDDKYYAELSWLLSYLLDALRTTADLSTFHTKKWFEKIFALAGNPYLRANLRNRILKILYRATCIEGGSTTLVTRFGIMSWLETQKAGCESIEDEAVYKALMRRVWITCDQKRVAEWSKHSIPDSLVS